MIFSDMLDELLLESADEGVVGELEYRGSFGTKIWRARIENEKQAHKYSLAPGNYTTINTNPIIHTNYRARQYAVNLLTKEITTFVRSTGNSSPRVLVVGLGNAFLIADSLGARVVQNLLPTHNLPTKLRNELGDMACCIPGVSGINGIPTYKIVRAVVDAVRPNLVIIIDALTARNYARLGCSFQLSDTSLTPGAGVGNHNRILNRESLGAEVLTIGVPLMINAKNFAELDELPNIVLAPKEIDILTKNCANIIAKSINFAIHGKNYQKYM